MVGIADERLVDPRTRQSKWVGTKNTACEQAVAPIGKSSRRGFWTTFVRTGVNLAFLRTPLRGWKRGARTDWQILGVFVVA